MALVQLPHTIQWETNGVDAFNTGILEYDDAALDPTSAAGVLVVALQNGVLPQLSSQCVLVSVRTGDDNLGGISTSGVPGGSAGTAAPPNCAYGAKKIVTSGRNGRWFLPGVVEGDVDENGRLTNSARAGLESGLNAMLVECAANGVDLFVPQNVLDPATLKYIPTTPVPIASFVAPAFITRQGRRLDRARGF